MRRLDALEKAPVVAGGAEAAPLIIDFFASDVVEISPAAPVPDPGTVQSTNWVRWQEQSNWSGYPQGHIFVDEVTTGNDEYGIPQDRRWICLEKYGAVGSSPGTPLVKVEYSLIVPETVTGKMWNLTPRWNYTGVGPGAWASTIGSGVSGNYGYFSDFPVVERDGAFASFSALNWRPKLTFYQQINTSGGATHVGFGLQITQTYPNADSATDFYVSPYVQCIVTIVKNNVWDGEISA